jgi:hypothetical protein
MPSQNESLLAWFPKEPDPEILTDPWFQSKLAVYARINEGLEALHDPNLPLYQPGPSHWPAVMNPARFHAIGGGERSGKSRYNAQEVAFRVTYAKMQGATEQLVWLAGESYENAHREFDYLITIFQVLGALPDDLTSRNPHVKKPDGRAWHMNLSGEWEGITIQTRTVDDPTKIASWALDGFVLCEAAQCRHGEEVWLRLRGRVAERRGWGILSGTFERQRGLWYKRLFNRWLVGDEEGHAYKFPTWENFAMFPGGWDDNEIVRLRERLDEDLFMERYAGIPTPPTSLVYPRFDPDIHVTTEAEYMPRVNPVADGLAEQWTQNTSDRLPVELAIDPGNSNYAILAIQRDEDEHGPLVYVIDEVFGRNQSTGDLVEVCRNRPWWKNIDPRYAGTIDNAARQRQGGTPTIKIWREISGFYLRARWVRVEDGIDKVRSFLEDYGLKSEYDDDGNRKYPHPAQWARLFVHPRCRRLTEEFQMYRFPENREPSEWTDPRPGWDHGVKALAYFLIDRYGPVRGKRHEVAAESTVW